MLRAPGYLASFLMFNSLRSLNMHAHMHRINTCVSFSRVCVCRLAEEVGHNDIKNAELAQDRPKVCS